MKRLLTALMICIVILTTCKTTREKKPYKKKPPIRIKRVIDAPDNKEMGCIIGTMKVHLDDPFSALKAGDYYNNITMVFKDKSEPREWKTITAKVIDGVYFIENLPPGEYSLIRFRFFEEIADIEVHIFYDIENFDFKVLPGTITTLDDITAKPKRVKRSYGKYVVVYDIKEEDHDLLRKYFYLKVDNDGYWADFTWRQHKNTKTIANFSESKMEMIHNIVLSVETDFSTVKRFMTNKDYQLAVVLGHRILKDLLKAYYIYSYDEDTIDIDEVPQTDDLKLLAEMANLELTIDQILFLADVTTYNDKIKNKSLTADEERYLFSEKFTTTYIENIKVLKEYIIELTDTETEVDKARTEFD